MSMSEKAQEAYDAAMKKVIIMNGTLCSTGSWAYGYIASDSEQLYTCRKNCRVWSNEKPREEFWTDFDSFHEGTPRGVIDLTGVNCDCGALKDRTIRWDVRPTEAIEAVFELEFGEDEK